MYFPNKRLSSLVALISALMVGQQAVSQSAIPDDKCAIITGATKDPEVALQAIKKFQEFGNPVVIQSSNGFLAPSVGIYKKSGSKVIVEEFKRKKLIPEDSYCGNTGRFIGILYPDQKFSKLISDEKNNSESRKAEPKQPEVELEEQKEDTNSRDTTNSSASTENVMENLVFFYRLYRGWDDLCGEGPLLDELGNLYSEIIGMVLQDAGIAENKYDDLKDEAWNRSGEDLQNDDQHRMNRQVFGAMSKSDRAKACDPIRSKEVGEFLVTQRLMYNTLKEKFNEGKPVQQRKRKF